MSTRRESMPSGNYMQNRGMKNGNEGEAIRKQIQALLFSRMCLREHPEQTATFPSENP